jgi:Mn-dependent DtxR family transcriptional regulator
MIARRIYRIMTCFLIFVLLVSNLLVAAALAQDLSETEIEKIEEIITTFASDPELGEIIEEEAVAAGLERSYLLAASPIMP